MKNSNLISIGLGLPLLWFAAYLLLVIIGCVAFQCGAGDQFYCSFYCKFGVGLMATATGGFLIYKVIQAIRSH